MTSLQTRVQPAPVALAAGGAFLLAASLLHPRGDAGAGQLANPLWTLAHLLLLVALLTLGVSLLGLIRERAATWPRAVRIMGWITVGALALATIEAVPHLLAVSEAEAAAVGGPSPFYGIHSTLEQFSNPLLGFSVATLSVVSVGSRALGGGPALAALGVIGGVTFGLANPLFAITGAQPAVILFDGSILIALWFMASGLWLVVRPG